MLLIMSFTVNPVMVPVLKNDTIPTLCTPVIEIKTQPKHGIATVVNDSIRYTTAGVEPAYLGRDSLVYQIACSGDTTFAKVYIFVYARPDNIVDPETCFVPTTPFEFKIKPQWVSAATTHSNAGVLVGDLDGDGLPEIVPGTDLQIFRQQQILTATDCPK
jgi:hypothetical protein